jgi:archaellum biogenesis ATPase FlaH
MGNVQNVPGVVRYVNNPANLTDMGIAVTKLLKELSGKEVCLLFDSVNSMLIYISSQNITKFIHFVTNKLRLLNFTGIFLVVEKGLDPDVLVQLITFVDAVIDVDKIPEKAA